MTTAKAKGRQALGRGLSALIPEALPSNKTTSDSQATASIERLRPNPSQPRKDFDDSALDELADSISSNGVLQPLLVRRAYETAVAERYRFYSYGDAMLVR